MPVLQSLSATSHTVIQFDTVYILFLQINSIVPKVRDCFLHDPSQLVTVFLPTKCKLNKHFIN